VIANNFAMPSTLKVGDWLCFGGMGSYTYGPKSSFNGMESTTRVFEWDSPIGVQANEQSPLRKPEQAKAPLEEPSPIPQSIPQVALWDKKMDSKEEADEIPHRLTIKRLLNLCFCLFQPCMWILKCININFHLKSHSNNLLILSLSFAEKFLQRKNQIIFLPRIRGIFQLEKIILLIILPLIII